MLLNDFISTGRSTVNEDFAVIFLPFSEMRIFLLHGCGFTAGWSASKKYLAPSGFYQPLLKSECSARATLNDSACFGNRKKT